MNSLMLLKCVTLGAVIIIVKPAVDDRMMSMLSMKVLRASIAIVHATIMAGQF